MNLQSIFYDCNNNTDMKPFPKDDRGWFPAKKVETAKKNWKKNI